MKSYERLNFDTCKVNSGLTTLTLFTFILIDWFEMVLWGPIALKLFDH